MIVFISVWLAIGVIVMLNIKFDESVFAMENVSTFDYAGICAIGVILWPLVLIGTRK